MGLQGSPQRVYWDLFQPSQGLRLQQGLLFSPFSQADPMPELNDQESLVTIDDVFSLLSAATKPLSELWLSQPALIYEVSQFQSTFPFSSSRFWIVAVTVRMTPTSIETITFLIHNKRTISCFKS